MARSTGHVFIFLREEGIAMNRSVLEIAIVDVWE